MKRRRTCVGMPPKGWNATWTTSTTTAHVDGAPSHTKLCPRCEKRVAVWTRSCTSCGWCFTSAMGEPPRRDVVKAAENTTTTTNNAATTTQKGKRVRAPTVAERHAKALARQACARAAKEEGVTLLGDEDPYTKKGKARKPLDATQGERLLATLFDANEGSVRK